MFEVFKRNRAAKFAGTILEESRPEYEVTPLIKPDRGQPAHRAKQPMVQTENQVLAYLNANRGRRLYGKDIGEALDIHPTYANHILRNLEQKRAVTPLGKGYQRRYQVNQGRVNRSQKPKIVKKYTSDGSKTNLDKVYDYISAHQGRPLRQVEISKAIGIHQATASQCIRSLVNLGKLKRRKLSKAEGSCYWLTEQAEAAEETPQPAKPTKLLAEEVEMFVWQYVKATSDMNVINFLKWLEEEQ